MTNRLAKEASPYLLMHAENPVDWYPWGETALTRAKQEDKPILLSIGYTACHWCHVMAHESFEDIETAKLMNDYFINIKVDREERPDLDKVYQLSAQLLTRQAGGWPLTIFLMPDTQVPFFAGTYFPKERRGNFPSFGEVLQYIHLIYQHHKSDLEQQNTSFENVLRELESQSKVTTPLLSAAPIFVARKLLEQSYDQENGGFAGAPKFPMTTLLNLFQFFARSGDIQAEEMLIHSLTKMIGSGLFDQLGGGFFRYSVDEKWQIPHFEKMLYDNALLLALLSTTSVHASLTNKQFLQLAIKKTADWMITEMQSDAGGYFATLAADTEGEEGKYYIWQREELQAALSASEYELISQYYGIDKHPNFKKNWHLQIMVPTEKLATERDEPITEVENKIEKIRQKLYNLRAQRTYPMRDEKIIVAWNGLAIKGMALAALYLNEEKYLLSAEKCVGFIQQHMFKNNRLYSVFKDGQLLQQANLDDYVFLVEGIFYLLQAKWQNEKFVFLKQLIVIILDCFEDKEAGGFYFTQEDHEKLIYRLKQYSDESLPSSNAVLTTMLLYLGYLQGDTAWLNSAENSLKNAFSHLQQYPDSYCSFLMALTLYLNPPEIWVIRGEESNLTEWKAPFVEAFSPNRVGLLIHKDCHLSSPLDAKKPEGNLIAYVCRGNKCLAPITNRQEFEHELRSNQFRISTES
jgi:uncharacterized protein YyaL (SSP411 family)